MIPDKNINLKLPIDTIIDVLLQVKSDRQEISYQMERNEKYKYDAINFREDQIEVLTEVIHEKDYEILKLNSRVVELENKLEAFAKFEQYEEIYKIFLQFNTPKLTVPQEEDDVRGCCEWPERE